MPLLAEASWVSDIEGVYYKIVFFQFQSNDSKNNHREQDKYCNHITKSAEVEEQGLYLTYLLFIFVVQWLDHDTVQCSSNSQVCDSQPLARSWCGVSGTCSSCLLLCFWLSSLQSEIWRPTESRLTAPWGLSLSRSGASFGDWSHQWMLDG